MRIPYVQLRRILIILISHFASRKILHARITSKANALDFIINGLSDILPVLLFNLIPLYHKLYYFSTFIIKIAFRQSEKLPHFFTLHYNLLLSKNLFGRI